MITVKTRALTLTEVLVVVVIVGVLAGLAMPIYRKAFEAARAREAVAALRQARTAQRLFHTRKGYYYPRGPATEGG